MFVLGISLRRRGKKLRRLMIRLEGIFTEEKELQLKQVKSFGNKLCNKLTNFK